MADSSRAGCGAGASVVASAGDPFDEEGAAGAFSRLGADCVFAGPAFFAPFAIASMISAFFRPATFTSSDLAISLSSGTALVSSAERSCVAICTSL
jgi:hypothetical protein